MGRKILFVVVVMTVASSAQATLRTACGQQAPNAFDPIGPTLFAAPPLLERLPPPGSVLPSPGARPEADPQAGEDTVASPADGANSSPEKVETPPAEETIIEGDSWIPLWIPRSDLWEGNVELGINGSRGNSSTFNFRFGTHLDRKTPTEELNLDVKYRKTTDDHRETANRLFGEGRNEWLVPDSPWTYFIHGTTEFDEFRMFDVRVTSDAGVGYQLIDSPTTQLTVRGGAGFSREIGGPDDSYVPEAVFGSKFEHRLTKRQKLTASADYFPDMTAFNDFRVNSEFSWLYSFDDEDSLSLKLSVLDRYDSTPNGSIANDLDYAALLLWSF